MQLHMIWLIRNDNVIVVCVDATNLEPVGRLWTQVFSTEYHSVRAASSQDVELSTDDLQSTRLRRNLTSCARYDSHFSVLETSY